MTPTEKQYAKNVGKLFIAKNKEFNHDKKVFQYTHSLCFVYGVYRTGYNGTRGAYGYKIQTLAPSRDDWKKEYTVKCKSFNGTTRQPSGYYWHRVTYLPATPENQELIGKVIDVPENE
jgi:hypothetical protein